MLMPRKLITVEYGDLTQLRTLSYPVVVEDDIILSFNSLVLALWVFDFSTI